MAAGVDIDDIDSKQNLLSQEESVVKNFRQAASLPCIFRCASIDDIATFFDEDRICPAASHSHHLSPEHILLYKVGLVLDLRSPSERDEAKAIKWMSFAPGGSFVLRTFDAVSRSRPLASTERSVYRIDLLSPSRLFNHLGNNWMNIAQKTMASIYFAVDANKLHELRMDVLNEKGLAGLYEAIIQTSGREFQAGLIAITEHLEVSIREGHNHRAIVVHCVQGKDRTGLLIMLCQILVGLSDEGIIADYHKSDALERRDEGSTAAESFGGAVRRKGKLDRSVFSGAPRKVMEDTLTWIRAEYGSVSPGYFDAIGFDYKWRQRFSNAMALVGKAELTTPVSRL